jgi:DNA-binding Xre family transcriptional regulator
MTTIRKLIEKKHGNLNRFSKNIGWSYQRVHYIATVDPNKMNLNKLSKIAKLLDCDIKDLI